MNLFISDLVLLKFSRAKDSLPVTSLPLKGESLVWQSCPVPSIGLMKLSMRPITCVKLVKRECLAFKIKNI